jgi:hypothetical protein
MTSAEDFRRTVYGISQATAPGWERQRARTACCEIELDRRGGVRSYRPLGGTCDCGTEMPVRPERRPFANRPER